MKGEKQHINPDGLFKSPAFSQIVTTQGSGRTIYVGGQNAADAEGNLVGKGDLSAQTVQVLKNIQTALAACGADFSHLVKLNIYIVNGQDVQAGFAASQSFFKDLKEQPAITGVLVAALTHPDYLVEIEAIAFLAG